jgi:hypothetical protein
MNGVLQHQTQSADHERRISALEHTVRQLQEAVLKLQGPQNPDPSPREDTSQSED